MKTLSIAFLLVSALSAETPSATVPKPREPVVAPKPADIPAARHEAISQVMLALQQAQIEAQSVQIQAQTAVTKAQKKVSDAQAAYDALEESLRTEFHVGKECGLTLTKTWDCKSASPQPTAKK